MNKLNVKTMIISAKVNEELYYQLLNDKHKQTHYREGYYVPEFLSIDGDSDYLNIEIDIESGKIINWKQPTEEFFDECIKLEIKKVNDRRID